MSGLTRPRSALRQRTTTASKTVVNLNTNSREELGFWDLISSFFWSLINWFFPVKAPVFTKTEERVDFTPVRPKPNQFTDPLIYLIKDEIFDGKNGINLWSEFRERLNLGKRNVSLYITNVCITYTDPETKKRICIHCDNLKDVAIIEAGKYLYIKLCRTKYCDTYIELNDYDFQIDVKKIEHKEIGCFTGKTTITVKRNAEKVWIINFEDLRIGDSILTENGFKKVKFITVSNAKNCVIFEININGVIIQGTPYHPVSINGTWIFMCNVPGATQIDDYTGNVYSIVFEDTTCTGYHLGPDVYGACLGHGLTDVTQNPVIGHDFFGNHEQIIASVSKLDTDVHRRSIVNNVKRNPDTGYICGFH